jgi:hypothetical protein
MVSRLPYEAGVTGILEESIALTPNEAAAYQPSRAAFEAQFPDELEKVLQSSTN